MNVLAPWRLRPVRWVLAAGVLVAGLSLCCLMTAGTPPLAQAGPAPSADKQVTLLYTINNSGYTDTCG